LGTDPPKSDQRDELFGELEELVKDAVLTGELNDGVLASLLELTVYSILNDRPIFGNVLEEPAFYRRYFYRWVKEGIDEVRKINGASMGVGATPPASTP
jgi:hypothetical protein